MPKLQRIKRSNGSTIFSMNFPLSLMEQMGWEKGEELVVEFKDHNGITALLIFRQKDEFKKRKEES